MEFLNIFGFEGISAIIWLNRVDHAQISLVTYNTKLQIKIEIFNECVEKLKRKSSSDFLGLTFWTKGYAGLRTLELVFLSLRYNIGKGIRGGGEG